jgi:hypothetical protein
MLKVAKWRAGTGLDPPGHGWTRCAGRLSCPAMSPRPYRPFASPRSRVAAPVPAAPAGASVVAAGFSDGEIPHSNELGAFDATLGQFFVAPYTVAILEQAIECVP